MLESPTTCGGFELWWARTVQEGERLPGSPIVPARICREYRAGGMLADVQSSWNREREALVSRLIEMGHQPLEHLDWDWLNKVDGVEAPSSMLVGVFWRGRRIIKPDLF